MYSRKASTSNDLKDSEDKALITRLIANVDVVVSNFRPGVIEPRGFGYWDCRKLNPRIIFAVCPSRLKSRARGRH